MNKDTGSTIVTRPSKPLGPVISCLCGRWNDSGRDAECPDCSRAVRGISGFMGRDAHADRRAFYRLEEEARTVVSLDDVFRPCGLSSAARQSLGLFTVAAIEDDLRGEVAA